MYNHPLNVITHKNEIEENEEKQPKKKYMMVKRFGQRGHTVRHHHKGTKVDEH